MDSARSRVQNIVWAASKRARQRRAELFHRLMTVAPGAKVLDLGSDDGTDIAGLGLDAKIWIADMRPECLEAGAARYGFTPVLLNADEPLPFPDGFFDVVFCSSVIEHVTGLDKVDVYDVRDAAVFESTAVPAQEACAKEIARVGKHYFVQTPARSFPIESHTWLPGAGYLPRAALVSAIQVANRHWVKKSFPDFRLLSPSKMAGLFPDAKIVRERWCGLTKSLIAVR